MIKIVEKSPVTTWISEPEVIKNFLHYEAEWWEQGPYRMEKRTAHVSLVKKGGHFLSGFQKRVFGYLDDRGMEYTFEKPDYEIRTGVPRLKGIEFRDDQSQALLEMMHVHRGVWRAPTGSGKTLLICGLVSAYRTTALIVVHTNTLFHQTIKELQRFFSKKDVGWFGAGEEKEGDVTVAMIQTLHRRGVDGKKWGMVVIDESHHANDMNKSYGKMLKNVLAPVRFGFTATLPDTEKGLMALEGLIGPVIGSTSYEELQKKEVLAHPIVRIYKVPETDKYRELKGGYKKIYLEGIVRNRVRNKLVIDKAREQIDAGRTVLVMVEMIEHGDLLLEMADLVMPGVFCFLHGNTDSDVREHEKESFEKGERRGVIATRIWSEGVNIRSIGSVGNAVGGEDEKATIQRFGRGMRRTEDKSEVHFFDFFDTNHSWFIKHSGNRICTYIDWGWLGG